MTNETLTQYELADKLGVSQTKICAIKNNDGVLSDTKNVIELRYLNEAGELVNTSVIHLDLLLKMTLAMKEVTVMSKLQNLLGIRFDVSDNMPLSYQKKS